MTISDTSNLETESTCDTEVIADCIAFSVESTVTDMAQMMKTQLTTMKSIQRSFSTTSAPQIIDPGIPIGKNRRPSHPPPFSQQSLSHTVEPPPGFAVTSNQSMSSQLQHSSGSRTVIFIKDWKFKYKKKEIQRSKRRKDWCAVMKTQGKKHEFKGRDLDSDLKRLMKGNIEPVSDLISRFDLSTPALGTLLSFFELLLDVDNYGNFTICKYDIGGFMRLDSAAMKGMNVMESKIDANKNFSLFGLMSRTCTIGRGKRLLHMWLQQPLVDLKEIKTRLDIVQCFVEEAGVRQDLRQYLTRISDVERLVQSLEKRRGGVHHIIKLYQLTLRLPFVETTLPQYTREFSSLLSERYLKEYSSHHSSLRTSLSCPGEY